MSMESLRIGCHVPSKNSAAHQQKLGADIVQIHIGSPRKWEHATAPTGDVASPVYVHAPYLVNLSAGDPDLLRKSTECLVHQADLAAEIGAEGLVVHGGSWKKSEMNLALIQWANVFSREWPVPILIENSASGDHSLTRYAKWFKELWKQIGAADRDDVGWCLDTCHLWVASPEPGMELGMLLRYLGNPSLIHANGTKSAKGSRIDRHSPWNDSVLDPGIIAGWIDAAECPNIIAETKDPESDLDMIREYLGTEIECRQECCYP